MVTNQYKIMIDTFHPGHYKYLRIFSTVESAHCKVALTLDMADKKKRGRGYENSSQTRNKSLVSTIFI